MPSTLGIAAGAAWTPLKLSPVLWLDASDTTTITQSGGAVSQWNDKSPSGLNVAIGEASRQPTTGADTQNGLNVLSFDGSADRLSNVTANSLGRNVTGLTVYVVRKFNALPTSERVMFTIRTAGTSARLSVTSGITSNKATVGGRTLDANSFARADSTSNVSTSAFEIQTGVFDYANTDLYLYLGSTLEGSNTSFQTATTTSDTNSSGFSVGGLISDVLFFNGLIAEILLYHSAHGASERDRVWTYLNSKWGL
jgi:hypothetical protein